MNAAQRRLAGFSGILALVLVLLAPTGVAALGICPGEVAGYILGLRGEVEVHQPPPGQISPRDWRPARTNQSVYIQDRIRTGPKAVAVLEFCDRVEDRKAGPTVFNVGEATEVSIASFEINYDVDRYRVRGFMDLIRGTIRAFITGWGQSTHFSVRAGVAICGIRGTEVTIKYIPEGERLTVTVHESEVVVAGPAGSRLVKTGQTAHFARGRPLDRPPS